MSNGTQNQGTPIDVEAQLNLIIQDVYSGFNSLAGQVRRDESKEDIAKELEKLALAICNHWPTCADENNLGS